MIKLQTTSKSKILPINDIVDELKSYFTLKQTKAYIYLYFAEKIESVLIVLEDKNVTIEQLFQAMKELDDLITKVNYHNSNIKNIERILNNLKRYSPMNSYV